MKVSVRFVAISALVLGMAVGTYSWQGLRASYGSCGDGFTWLGFTPVNWDVVRVDDECIGVTDGSNAHLLPPGELFNQGLLVRLKQHVFIRNC